MVLLVKTVIDRDYGLQVKGLETMVVHTSNPSFISRYHISRGYMDEYILALKTALRYDLHKIEEVGRWLKEEFVPNYIRVVGRVTRLDRPEDIAILSCNIFGDSAYVTVKYVLKKLGDMSDSLAIVDAYDLIWSRLYKEFHQDRMQIGELFKEAVVDTIKEFPTYTTVIKSYLPAIFPAKLNPQYNYLEYIAVLNKASRVGKYHDEVIDLFMKQGVDLELNKFVFIGNSNYVNIGQSLLVASGSNLDITVNKSLRLVNKSDVQVLLGRN